MSVNKGATAVMADTTTIRMVIDAIAAAHHAKDAAAIARHYTATASIADLAPPLTRRGLDVGGLQAWLDGWDGPVEMTTRELRVVMDRDLAVAHGLRRIRARAGEVATWWSRWTLALHRTPGGWRVVHEHDSVPFYMDGSVRAALDLLPPDDSHVKVAGQSGASLHAGADR